MQRENLHLLLVEDDIDLATAIIDYLELEDICCDHATNGVSGLSLIQNNHYDAVILDLNLPKMNGLIVFEKIRKQVMRSVMGGMMAATILVIYFAPLFFVLILKLFKSKHKTE